MRHRYICKPNPTCKDMHLLFLISLQSNLSCTFKLEHPQGEMTPIHLIPRIISRLHLCWFSVSVWTAGIEVRLGSVTALFQLSFRTFSSKARSGSGFAKDRADLNPVTTKLWPAVGKRRDNIKLYIFDNGTAGDWHFCQNPNNTVGFLQLFIWEWKTFFACNRTSACQHALIQKIYS